MGGSCSDRVGRRQLIWLGCAIGAAGMLVLALAPGQPEITVLGVRFPLAGLAAVPVGVGAGMFIAVDWALMVDIIPRATAGRYMGISNVVTATAGAIAGFIAGVIMAEVTRGTGEAWLGPRVAFAVTLAWYAIGAWALRRVDTRPFEVQMRSRVEPMVESAASLYPPSWRTQAAGTRNGVPGHSEVVMGIRTRLLGGGDESIARARRPEAFAASLGFHHRRASTALGHGRRPRHPSCTGSCCASVAGSWVRGMPHRVDVKDGRTCRGGFILVTALHRNWIDPLVVLRALPIEPRVWFLGSGPTAFDRPWKERLLRRTGGNLPVWRGGASVDPHVEAAKAVVEEGGILGLFIEGRIAGPPDRLARAQHGAALLALRTGEPVVPWSCVGPRSCTAGSG